MHWTVKFSNGFTLNAVKGADYSEAQENAIEEMEERGEVHGEVISIRRDLDTDPND